MRANEVRDALVAAVEAIEPDETYSAGDLFCLIDKTDSDGEPDRSFSVSVSDVANLAGWLVLSEDAYTLSFSLEVWYGGTNSDTQDRILRDSERLLDAVLTLEASATYQQIHQIEVAGGSVTYVEDGAIVQYSLSVTYDPRDPA